MEVTVRVPPGVDRVAVTGAGDRNLKLLRDALGVQVLAREGRVAVHGPKPAVVASRRVLEQLVDAAQARTPMSRQQVLDLIAAHAGEALERQERGWSVDPAADDTDAELLDEPDEAWEERLNVYVGGKPVRPRTPNQLAYLRAIRENDLVFGLGPAGTGKTYLAVAAAVHLLRSGRCKRVVLTRPAVEAGEKLGFLPGDLREKVHPYLRPLFDALNDMMDFATARRFMEHDVVEVVPLAFMRGRTLNHSVVILDEAQNATKVQMKMFLTRMGQGSKMIVTGDPTQTDLEEDVQSGLVDAAGRLARTQGVAFIGFQQSDVVRHDLVKRIIEAYDEPEGDSPRHSSRSSRAPRGPSPWGGRGPRRDIPDETSENARSDDDAPPMNSPSAPA